MLRRLRAAVFEQLMSAFEWLCGFSDAVLIKLTKDVVSRYVTIKLYVETGSCRKNPAAIPHFFARKVYPRCFKGAPEFVQFYLES